VGPPSKNCHLAHEVSVPAGLEGEPMNGLMGFLGAIVGGWLGWWLGDFVGLMTAYIVSTIMSGVGLYFGRRFAQWLVE
jgi:hypothetical protein